MDCFLENHVNKYDIYFTDGLISACTLFSGASFAKRHWDLSNSTEGIYSLGHRIIAIIEILPFGAIAALIEKIVYLASVYFSTLELVEDNTALEKMLKNSKKAIEEHLKKESCGGYASVEEGLPTLEEIKAKVSSNLYIEHSTAENIGNRIRMEDFQFVKAIDQGVLAGIFDGHCGTKVAEYANDFFQHEFELTLNRNQGNVLHTIYELFQELENQVVDNEEWYKKGSAALLCFIDRQGIIYTATLGNSEANIYRKVGESIKSIALSCVRNWSSQKDAKRAAEAMNRPDIATTWPEVEKPEELEYEGLKVSRTIGDKFWKEMGSESALTHKPKITVNKLKAGDVVVLASDGLKGVASEYNIFHQVTDTRTDLPIAERLVNYAVNIKATRDNVSVIGLTVH